MTFPNVFRGDVDGIAYSVFVACSGPTSYEARTPSLDPRRDPGIVCQN